MCICHMTRNKFVFCWPLSTIAQKKNNMQMLEVPCPSYLLYCTRGSKDYGCNLHTRGTSWIILSRNHIVHPIISDYRICRSSVIQIFYFIILFWLGACDIYNITFILCRCSFIPWLLGEENNFHYIHISN